MQGVIRMNETLLLGPTSLGEFIPIAIRGIHRKRMPVKEVRGGQTASFCTQESENYSKGISQPCTSYTEIPNNTLVRHSSLLSAYSSVRRIVLSCMTHPLLGGCAL